MYMSGAMLMVKKWAEDHLGSEWSESLLFGFEPHNRCEDLVGCVQSAVQAAQEWAPRKPIVIINSDVKQAFDFVAPATVATCMKHWGVPPLLTRALVRESLFVRAEAMCVGVPTTGCFGMTRCIRQGGSNPLGLSIWL